VHAEQKGTERRRRRRRRRTERKAIAGVRVPSPIQPSAFLMRGVSAPGSTAVFCSGSQMGVCEGTPSKIKNIHV